MPTKSVEQVLKAKRIEEITTPKLVQAPPEISAREGIELMQKNRAGYIVVAKNKKVVGIFTENDVIKKILDKDIDWNLPISNFMTANPPLLKPTDLVGTAIDVMGEKKVYHIPLVDDNGDLVNVLSVRTLTRFLAEFYPTEIYNLPPRPDQVMPTQEGG
jgi:CBS domain-containing protein